MKNKELEKVKEIIGNALGIKPEEITIIYYPTNNKARKPIIDKERNPTTVVITTPERLDL